MKRGIRQDRLCQCGCGEPVKQQYDSSGQFKGYHRYAAGHGYRHRWADQQFRAGKIADLDKARMVHTLPDFSRRIHDEHGLRYWQIKVPGRRRWMYEHRYLMEQSLGRTLDRKEHVHHLDGDGLNNALENLMVLSHSAHSSLTSKQYGGPQKTWKGGRHKCPICLVEH